MPVSTLFDVLIQRIEALGVSTNITLYTLSLGVQDAVTGWYAKNYDVSTINMVIIPRSAQSLLIGSGTYCRKDAVAFSKTLIQEGDVVTDGFGYNYTITGMRPHGFGNVKVFHEYDLEYTPFFIVPETVLPPSGDWGFEQPMFETATFEHGTV